jgi:hypothetical protein
MLSQFGLVGLVQLLLGTGDEQAKDESWNRVLALALPSLNSPFLHQRLILILLLSCFIIEIQYKFVQFLIRFLVVSNQLGETIVLSK